MARPEEEQTTVSRVGVPPPTRAVPSPEQKELIASGKASPTGLAVQQFPGLERVSRAGDRSRSANAAIARNPASQPGFAENKSVYTDEYVSSLPPARAIENLPEKGSEEEKSLNTYRAVADAIDARYTDPERLGTYMKRVESAANYMVDFLSQNRDLLESQTYGYEGNLIRRSGTGHALPGLMQMIVDADKAGNEFTKDALQMVLEKSTAVEGVEGQQETERIRAEGKEVNNTAEWFGKQPSNFQKIIMQAATGRTGLDDLSQLSREDLQATIEYAGELRKSFEPEQEAVPSEGGAGTGEPTFDGDKVQFESPQDLYAAEEKLEKQGKDFTRADLVTMAEDDFEKYAGSMTKEQRQVAARAIMERKKVEAAAAEAEAIPTPVLGRGDEYPSVIY